MSEHAFFSSSALRAHTTANRVVWCAACCGADDARAGAYPWCQGQVIEEEHRIYSLCEPVEARQDSTPRMSTHRTAHTPRPAAHAAAARRRSSASVGDPPLAMFEKS